MHPLSYASSFLCILFPPFHYSLSPLLPRSSADGGPLCSPAPSAPPLPTTYSLYEKISMNYYSITFLGFDPGKDKCGIAVMKSDQTLLFHQVVPSGEAIATIFSLAKQFPVEKLIIGDQTTAKKWIKELEKSGWSTEQIAMIDERYSSLEARDRYWQMYPPKGLQWLIPQGMRQPPRPVDDIVAIILIERYLAKINAPGNT